MDRNQEILKLFSECKSWEDNYTKIIELGKNLQPLAEKEKTEKTRVEGCQAQIWLKAVYTNNKLVFYGDGDGDALISRGLLALMLKFYSGLESSEILDLEPSFLKTLSLSEHLSPARVNGLSSLIKRIKYTAKAYNLLNS